MMQTFLTRWRSLFFFCLGISIATAFITLWLEGDFWVNDEKFSILGLELFYSKSEVLKVLKQIKQPARAALGYHLVVDFAFMAGVYPGIASLCMLVREKFNNTKLRGILFALAILQPVAWIFSMVENCYLLNWMNAPEIGDEFSLYHRLVLLKWLIALTGFFLAGVLFLRAPKTKYRR